MAEPALRISVLLPYRDNAETLVEAVESLLGVDQPDLEILAIDDGSRDDGPRRIRQLATRYPHVRPLATPGVGIAGALRFGLSHARAPFLARMDGDDRSRPGRLRRQLEALESDPGLAVVGGRVAPFPDHLVGDGMRFYIAWQNGIIQPAHHHREIFVESPLCHPSVMIRRRALEDVGPWRDGDLPEDYDLWLRLDAAGWRLGKVPETVLDWRHHPGRSTFSDPRYRRDRFRLAKAPHLARRILARGMPLVIWGTGPTGRRLARELEKHGVVTETFVDVDPKRFGRRVRNAPVIPVADLKPGRAFVVAAVASRGARQQIRESLHQTGFVEGDDFLCAA